MFSNRQKSRIYAFPRTTCIYVHSVTQNSKTQVQNHNIYELSSRDLLSVYTYLCPDAWLSCTSHCGSIFIKYSWFCSGSFANISLLKMLLRSISRTIELGFSKSIKPSLTWRYWAAWLSFWLLRRLWKQIEMTVNISQSIHQVTIYSDFMAESPYLHVKAWHFTHEFLYSHSTTIRYASVWVNKASTSQGYNIIGSITLDLL